MKDTNPASQTVRRGERAEDCQVFPGQHLSTCSLLTNIAPGAQALAGLRKALLLPTLPVGLSLVRLLILCTREVGDSSSAWAGPSGICLTAAMSVPGKWEAGIPGKQGFRTPEYENKFLPTPLIRTSCQK